MEKEGTITIGELAKRANVSVRTLQYYDKINLLKPLRTEGGRRFYVDSDIVILHQIIALKSLGLSLDEIKNNLTIINNQGDVTNVLNNQSKLINRKISKLQSLLESINMLTNEITETGEVNWSHYASFVSLINENEEYYWITKHFDKDVLFRRKEELGEDIKVDWWIELSKKAIELESLEKEPEGEEGQELAKVWWENVMKFTGGDLSILEETVKFHGTRSQWPEEFKLIQKKADPFIYKALGEYFKNNNITELWQFREGEE